MVVPVGPVKFYGNSLPRPRVYTDVKLNTERVDPPVPVMDPLLSWAQEAHWSMGGLSFSRLRLQGRIEGNVDRLRKFREKHAKPDSPVALKNLKESKVNERISGVVERNGKKDGSVSPPRALKVTKRRRRYVDLFDEESELDEEEEEEQREDEEKLAGGGKKRLARKLVGDFDRVAKESGIVKKRRAIEVERDDVRDSVVEHVNRDDSNGKRVSKSERNEKSTSAGGGTRTSPGLARQKPN